MNDEQLTTDEQGVMASKPGCNDILFTPRKIAVPGRDVSLRDCPTNLDLTTRKGRAQMFNAVGPCSEDIQVAGVVKLNVTHWVIHPDTATNQETGEVSEVVRTVFIGDDGRTYRTTSPHAVAKIREAMALFTQREWEQGIPFVVTERRSKQPNRTYHDIKIDWESM